MPRDKTICGGDDAFPAGRHGGHRGARCRAGGEEGSCAGGESENGEEKNGESDDDRS